MGPKQQKNAFFFYLKTYVETERQKGRHISFKIAAEECAPVWKALPEQMKQKYKDIARMEKECRKSDKENKLTSTGISIGRLEREQLELRIKTEKADSEVTATIFDLDTDSLKTHLFYIIHCNYYCKTEEGNYVPGELALVEFNLENGIRRTFHTLINPGPIPLGYAFDARNRIENIHGLPYPPYDEGESDYFGILDKLLHFLEPGKLSDGRNPPLYCLEDNVSPCENILRGLGESSAGEDPFFRVFFLHKMFFWLKNKCTETLDEPNLGFHVVANAESEILKDIFRYVPAISCSFHAASEDKYQSCSLSIVQRQVYLICDHCCQYVGVKLVPGQHCRLKADVNRRPEKRLSPTHHFRVTEMECDGGSSYGGDLSCGGLWGEGEGEGEEGEGEGEGGEKRCSFLQDELDLRFSNLALPSVASDTSTHSVSSEKWKKVKENSKSSKGSNYIKITNSGGEGGGGGGRGRGRGEGGGTSRH